MSKKCFLLITLLLAFTTQILATELSIKTFSPLNKILIERQRVSRIDIEILGTSSTNNKKAFDLIDIKVGEEFSLAKVKNSLKKMYQAEYASDVKVFVTEEKNTGLILRFAITPQFRVGEIFIIGNQAFGEEEIKPRLTGLSIGAKFSNQAVEKAKETVREFYREKGFFRTKIESTLAPPTLDGRINITYKIDRGEQAILSQTLEIKGALRLDKKKLEEKIKCRAGTPHTTEQLAEDIRQIRQMHLEANYLHPQISSPTISYNESTNKIAITINIDSGPLVDLKIKGFELSRKEQQRILPVLQEGGLNDFVLDAGKQQLLDYVQQAGYFFATVSYSLAVFEDKATLIYSVDKRQRYKITSIELLGTKEFTYKELSNELISKTHSIIPPSRGLTSKEALSHDAKFIEQKFQSIGYTEAKITEQRLGVTPDNENLEVTFIVDEGKRTLIEDIDLEGNKVFSTDQLKAILPKQTNQYLSKQFIDENITSLYSFYEKTGYAKVHITSDIKQIKPNVVRLLLNIQEGKKIFINEITVSVRGRTSKNAILAYIPFRKGDLLRQSLLTSVEQNLYATGAFKQVAFRTQLTRSDNLDYDLYDVFLDVVDSSSYTIAYGLGYQDQKQQRGPQASFEISNNNIFGKLQSASVILRAGFAEQSGQVSYQLPHLFRSQFPALASLLFQRVKEVSFSSERQTALLQTEKKLNPLSSLIFRYRFENVRIFDIKAFNELGRNDQTIQLGRVSTTYLRDTRDNILDTTKGTFSIADISIASTFLGGTEKFSRFFGQYQNFIPTPIFPKTVWANSVRVGIATTYGGSNSIPISERFFSGGSNTLRGFSFEEAGPRDEKTDRPIGGNTLIVLNTELRFPIWSKLEGTTFYDTGNVFKTISEVSIKNFTNTLGVGLRLKTPLGPFRVDFGYLINPPFYVAVKDQRLSNLHIHFSFGQAF